MLALSAHPLGLRTAVLDPLGESSPAGQVASQAVKGDFKSAQEILAFVDQVKPDVLTVEIEHVNVDALVTVQQTRPQVVIQPSPETIRVIQDKFVQKVHLKSVALASLLLRLNCKKKTSWHVRNHGIALPEFKVVNNKAEIAAAGEEFGYPIMVKSRKLAYDGRGNAVVKSPAGTFVSSFHCSVTFNQPNSI